MPEPRGCGIRTGRGDLAVVDDRRGGPAACGIGNRRGEQLGPGAVRHVAIQGRTKSGRVSELEIETERGAYAVRGDDIRFVIRQAGGEMLSSTYFSVEPAYSSEGTLEKVTFRGQGYGHGVGMCQWGAIGRARAGHTFRQILATYYPGTSVGPIQ